MKISTNLEITAPLLELEYIQYGLTCSINTLDGIWVRSDLPYGKDRLISSARRIPDDYKLLKPALIKNRKEVARLFKRSMER